MALNYTNFVEKNKNFEIMMINICVESRNIGTW